MAFDSSRPDESWAAQQKEKEGGGVDMHDE
jgi:hypothetical protein